MSCDRCDPVVSDSADTEPSDAEFLRLMAIRNDLCDLIAHELRGPLTAIIGFSARALRRGIRLPPEATEALSVIHQQAMEMAFRIDLLVRASEFDDPQFVSEPMTLETVALDQLLNQEAILLRHRYPAVLIHRHGTDGGHIESEPHRIREIVANLLDNAARYGGGTVTITTHRGTSEVFIDVHNDGPEIPDELQSRVFERGFRAPDAHRLEPSGSGLGLFVAYQLTRQLGGGLTCSSAATSGTSFVLNLPLRGPHLELDGAI